MLRTHHRVPANQPDFGQVAIKPTEANTVTLADAACCSDFGTETSFAFVFRITVVASRFGFWRTGLVDCGLGLNTRGVSSTRLAAQDDIGEAGCPKV